MKDIAQSVTACHSPRRQHKELASPSQPAPSADATAMSLLASSSLNLPTISRHQTQALFFVLARRQPKVAPTLQQSGSLDSYIYTASAVRSRIQIRDRNRSGNEQRNHGYSTKCITLSLTSGQDGRTNNTPNRAPVTSKLDWFSCYADTWCVRIPGNECPHYSRTQ